MYMTTLGKFQARSGGSAATGTTVQGSEEETKPLLSGIHVYTLGNLCSHLPYITNGACCTAYRQCR